MKKIRKIVLTVVFVIFMVNGICIQGSEMCKPDLSSPGGDNCDDNYSFSTYAEKYTPTASDFVSAECLILDLGYVQNAMLLLDKIGKKWATLGDGESIFDINNPPGLLLIPSGGLFSKDNDSYLKYTLSEYVRRGNSIVCFTQQIPTQ
jgi:hypothetical protein